MNNITVSSADNRSSIQELLNANFHLIRIDRNTKIPVDSGWVTTSIKTPESFFGKSDALAYNIGIATGSVSGGVICVDLDGVTADVAAQFLPETGMKDGRISSPKTHWYYRLSDTEFPDEILPGSDTQIREAMNLGRIPRFPGVKHFKSEREVDGEKPGIDVLMSGGQIVVPPSMHHSGEVRTWDGGTRGEPAPIKYQDLMECVKKLAVHIGWKEKAVAQKRERVAKVPKQKKEKVEKIVALTEPPFPTQAADEKALLAVRNALKNHGPAISGHGGRQHTYIACCLLGDYGLNKTQAEEEILRWNETCTPPWERNELLQTLGNSYISRKSPVGSVSATPVDEGIIGSDLYLAEQFVRDHYENVRYCLEYSTWLIWDTRRWVMDKGGVLVQELAKETAKRLRLDAAKCNDLTKGKQLWSAALRAASGKGISGMLHLAHSDPKVVIHAEDLDHPEKCRYFLNAPNGVIDLRSGKLLDHDKSLLMTKMTGADYNPEAQHPAVMKVLSTLTGGDASILDCLQRVFGMAATGDTSAKVLVSIIGPPDCGKGTSLEAHRAALGDYVRVAPVDLFIDSDAAGRATPEIAALKGIRTAYANETREGAKLDADKLKRIVGGDEQITGRPLFKDFITFQMEALLILASNDKPWINDTDDAMWKRLLVFEPVTSIPADQRDPRIKRDLQRDPVAMSAWLGMVVQGAKRWYSDGGGYQGLKVPRALEDIRAKYRAEVDPLADFVANRLVLDPQSQITRAQLHSAYVNWCRDHGARPMSNKAFATRIRKLSGVFEGVVNRVLGWNGIGVTCGC